MPFSKISDLLGLSAHKRGVSTHMESAMVLEFFNSIIRDQLGAEALASMRPLYLKDRILTVAVLLPQLAQMLKDAELTFVNAINEKAGHEVVTGLRLLS